MKGSEAKMIEYMEGAGKRGVIVVYMKTKAGADATAEYDPSTKRMVVH